MKLVCCFCLKPIESGEQFVNEKIPGTIGESLQDYNRYHNRHSTDCFAQHVDAEVLQ